MSVKAGKRVLHVVSISFSLPYFIGDQFKHFRNKGIIYYVASSASEHLYKYSDQQHFTAWPIGITRTVSPLRDLMAIWKLRKLIKDNKIDIVIGHTPKGGLIAMLASYTAGIKNRVYFRHGILYETSTGIKRALLKRMEAFTGKLATRVVCVSKSILKISENECLSLPIKNIILAKGTCNGIDAYDRFNRRNLSQKAIELLKLQYGIAKVDYVFGFVGRLVKDKGIEDLIRAFRLLIESKKNIKLLLVGPLEERDAISGDIKNYILNEPSIIFTDIVEDTVNFYGLMNVFILPSYREGFPTVVLEASSMELPVITTRATGCIDSIIENETGIFCTHEPLDIAEKMNYYYKDQAAAIKHGVNGRRFILENFAQEKIWDEIETKILS